MQNVCRYAVNIANACFRRCDLHSSVIISSPPTNIPDSLPPHFFSPLFFIFLFFCSTELPPAPEMNPWHNNAFVLAAREILCKIWERNCKHAAGDKYWGCRFCCYTFPLRSPVVTLVTRESACVRARYLTENAIAIPSEPPVPPCCPDITLPFSFATQQAAAVLLFRRQTTAVGLLSPLSQTSYFPACLSSLPAAVNPPALCRW